MEDYGMQDKANITFTNFLDWFVKINNPIGYWNTQPNFIITQLIFIVGGILTFVHALKQGGRWPFFYISCILHGLTSEFISYIVPHIDNFWHSQTPIIFFGRRLPLYIIFLYPLLYYHSSWATSKINLSTSIARQFCVGLLTVLIDLPFDIIGVKYLFWVWHDTDPNIGERHYYVPWNSYYFHICFAVSFSFFFHHTRKFIDKSTLQEWQRGTLKSEVISVLTAGLLGMPGGCLLFLPLYHPFHDIFKIHSEVTTLTLIIIILMVVWRSDRNSIRTKKPKLDRLSMALLTHLFIYYTFLFSNVLLFNPKEVITIGLYEPVGNCKETIPLETLLTTLEKRKYLCVTDYDEKYYDFHCRNNQEPPKDGMVWYTICGTEFENKMEYILILALINFVALMVFSSLHFDFQYVRTSKSKFVQNNVKTMKKKN